MTNRLPLTDAALAAALAGKQALITEGNAWSATVNYAGGSGIRVQSSSRYWRPLTSSGPANGGAVTPPTVPGSTAVWFDDGPVTALVPSSNLSDLSSAPAARTALGLGSLATVTPTGTASATTFLRGDGTYATPISGGATLVPTATKSTAYTASVNDLVLGATTSATPTPITLPTAPADRSQVAILADSLFTTTAATATAAAVYAPVTYAVGSGDTLDLNVSGSLSVPGDEILLQYVAATKVWEPIEGRLPLSILKLTFDPQGAAAVEQARALAAEALALQKSANLSDLASASSARTNLGLGTAATQPSTAFDAAGAAAAAPNTLGTSANPVTSATAARPTGLTDVYWQCSTLPTNIAAGDLWEDTSSVAVAAALPRYYGVDNASLNPLPTTLTDIPGSSLTFSLAAAGFFHITYSCRLQENGSATATAYLNIDGTNQPKILVNKTTGATEIDSSPASQVHVSLAAGSHTIKMQGIGTTASNSVLYDGCWMACEVAS